MESSPMQIELAFIQADLHRIHKAVSDLAVNTHKSERELQLKLERKESIIKGLQQTLRNINKQNKLLQNELKNVTSIRKTGAESEIDKLRKENKELKKKNKAKARKIRQYKYLLEEVVGDQYEDDPDEEDGEPDEDSVGAEDIEMVDEQTLLEDDDDDDDTDPDDSDFELNDKEKKKMKKLEAEEEIDETETEEKEEEAAATKEKMLLNDEDL